jgi:hypothetical protein
MKKLTGMKEDIYRQARKQVKKKKGVYIHLAVYLSVGLFFLLLNLATFEGEWWFFFPLLPWGVGLSIHYLSVFGIPGTDILTKEWEKREMEQELRKRGYSQSDRPALPPESQAGEKDLDLNAPEKMKEKRWEEDDIV